MLVKTNTFANGNTIDAAQVNTNFDELVAAVNTAMPDGAIILWSGSVVNIPSGWYLCNGSNGTPDLRGRFVVGAGGSYSVDATGGEATHTITVSEMPSHTHIQNAHTHTQTAHSHTIAGSKDGQETDNYSASKGAASADRLAGWYANGIGSTTAVNQNTTAVNKSTGGGSAHENRPPYYALCYIMKGS